MDRHSAKPPTTQRKATHSVRIDPCYLRSCSAWGPSFTNHSLLPEFFRRESPLPSPKELIGPSHFLPTAESPETAVKERSLHLG